MLIIKYCCMSPDVRQLGEGDRLTLIETRGYVGVTDEEIIGVGHGR